MPSSLGPAEILVVLVVALIVLGPNRLPQAGRQIGRAIAEVRRWSNSMQAEIRDVLDTDADDDRKWVPTPAQAPPVGGAPTEADAPSGSSGPAAPATSAPATSAPVDGASANGSSPGSTSANGASGHRSPSESPAEAPGHEPPEPPPPAQV